MDDSADGPGAPCVGLVFATPLGMLPLRKSEPAPRRPSFIGAEVRVPAIGAAFGALARSVRSDSLFLATYQELVLGTKVVVELSLRSGNVVVEGVVAPLGRGAGPDRGMMVELVDVDVETRLLLDDEALAMRLTRIADVA